MKEKSIEEQLKDLIKERYGSLLKFSNAIGLPNSTLMDMIQYRGLANASIRNVLKICSELQISADELYEGYIVPVQYVGNDARKIIDETKDRLTKFATRLDGIPINSHDVDLLIESLEIAAERIKKRKSK